MRPSRASDEIEAQAALKEFWSADAQVTAWRSGAGCIHEGRGTEVT